MKKLVAAVLVSVMVALVAAPAVNAAKDQGAATVLSVIMPGAGEWYNNNYKSGFPFVECIVGHICFLVQLSSVVDAANGNSDDGMRIDFWSAPK